MSVILQPQTAFPIVRQIANHTDATVYYVRAVVRDANGDVIATVNLDSQGAQRYQTSWQVPADSSGQGRYISVVTSVYTDSGYTTKSENYGDEETTYLIFDRVMPAMRGGGGGSLDSGTLRRIIGEELDKREKEPEKFPEIKMPEMKWGEVMANLGFIADEVSKIPKKQADLSPALERMSELKDLVVNKEVTPETDLTSVVSAINGLMDRLDTLEKDEQFEREDLKASLEDMKTTLLESYTEIVENAIDSTEFVTTQSTMPAKRMRQKDEERSNFDLNKFVS